MALWGRSDNSANAPKWTVLSGFGSSANGFTAYQNVQTSAFESGAQLGIEGVNTVEIANPQLSNGAGFGKAAHTGWNLRKQGTGYVSSVSISGGGQGYNANGFITFTGGGGISGSNANASYVIANSLNSQQAFSSNPLQNTIITVTLNSPGSNYTSAPVANAFGANITAATFTVTMGGRVGRVQFETLAAMTNVV
jgi:hypothetical protein